MEEKWKSEGVYRYVGLDINKKLVAFINRTIG